MDEPRSPEMAEREAAWRAADAKWLTESQRPQRERGEFQVGEIADALAQRPGRFEVDYKERARIAYDLFKRILRGEFPDSDVLKLVGQSELFEPASFRGLQEDAKREGITITAMPDYGPRRPAYELLGNGDVLVNIDALILRRAAVRCYLEGSGLEGARRVLLEWFPEPAVTPLEPAAVSGAIPSGMDGAGVRVAPPSHDQSGELVRSPNDQHAKRAATQSDKPERPRCVSDRAWQRHRDATRLKPGFEGQRGGIAEAVRLVAGGQKGDTLINSIRRDLSRVRQALNKK